MLLILTGGVSAKAAAASEDGPSFGSWGRNNAIAVAAERARREAARASAEQARSVANGPTPISILVVACPGNGPQPGFRNAVFCDTARLGCESTPETTDILQWVWPALRDPDGSIRYGASPSGSVCAQEGAAAAEPVVELTLADFRRLPLPPGTGNVQPGNGYTLVNVPTNVYAQAEPVHLSTTLLGIPVEVRATPARYSWDFGDGGTLGPTTDPGAAYPALRTTHEYTQRGQYAITLTTHYTGEYSVAGGPWLPVQGEATVTGEPVAVRALAGRNHLVDGPLHP